MDIVLENYRKSSCIRHAALDSNHVGQWYEWGSREFDVKMGIFSKKIDL